MTLKEYNAYCKRLPHTTHVVQWGGAHVWKIGGKVFAIGGWNRPNENLFVTFKCSPASFDMLKEMPGLRPAPYLASRGMSWIQWINDASLDDVGLRDYIAASHYIVAAGLPKKLQAELGLDGTTRRPAAQPRRTRATRTSTSARRRR